MSGDDKNNTYLDVRAEEHSADLLEPLAAPARRAVLGSLTAWCLDRPVSRSDVADMIEFHFGIIDQEELVRRGDVRRNATNLFTHLGQKGWMTGARRNGLGLEGLENR
ncbi:hypothetical protein [Arthrobacter subterraneus]|uniref:hypothetical protein n=1 Tax=Arthrobacter subterraneus TaxID=335973 RepID=UPI0011146598|nr:hypothetical protein [Arthrobacter subterraneus]